MNIELKKAIIEWIFDNINEFQIVNNCVKEFRDYIYNKQGNYLIGGKQVSDFITRSIYLIKE